MSAVLNQVIYIENRHGVSGTIAIPEVMRHPADGLTLYLLASTTLVAPVLFPSVPADFLADFDAIGQTDWGYNILCVAPERGFNSVADVVAASRSTPREVSYASGGNGTPPHLAGEMFSVQAGLELNHIPYVQIGQAAGDVIGGAVDLIFMGASGALPLIRDGRLKPLAVTSPERVAALPDVPTMMELGYPEFRMRPFNGLLIRSGASSDTINRLNRALNEALAQPQVQTRMSTLGMQAAPTTPAEFEELLRVESKRWVELAQRAQLKVD